MTKDRKKCADLVHEKYQDTLKQTNKRKKHNDTIML